MKKIISRLGVVLFAVFLSQSVFASIDPGATSATHHFEEAAAAIHEYLHHNYGASYDSHGLEQRGSALHHVLHDWQHGEATEADVVVKMEELKLEWNNFRQTIIPASILNLGDVELNELYQTVKDTYKEVRFLLRKAK